LKPLDQLVTRKLGEILITHGQSSLTDARLCENLLKDYCGEYKEEISLLVLGVKERIAIDLLSQDAVERDVLRSLLTTRLRRNNALNESDARWIVDSWSIAVRTLARADATTEASTATRQAVAKAADGLNQKASANRPPPWDFGIIHQSRSAIRSVAFSHSDDTIAFAGDDGCVRLWQPQTGQAHILEECAGPVSGVRFSPNGVLLAIVSNGPAKSRVRVCDLQAGETLELGEIGSRLPSLAFSPGGTRLACGSAGSDGMIRVWNLQNGQTQILRGAWGGPGSISFSPDGKFIAAADATLSDAAIRIWNLDTGTADTLGNCHRQITSVAFSPDGTNVASGSWDETVCLWDVRTKKATLLGRNCSCVSCVAFSPPGDKIAVCSLDSKVRLWKLPGERPRTIGHCDNVNDIAFSADGSALTTASSDGTVRLWDVQS
jgi:hypothetical protein